MKYLVIASILGVASTVALTGCKVENTLEGKVQLPKYAVQKTQRGG